MSDWAGYPGSKAAGGVAERIAGMLPPHRIYIEAFIGHGAVWRRKRPAEWQIGLDLNPDVVHRWQRRGFLVFQSDAVKLLSSWAAFLEGDAVVYVDAPYLRRVRTRLLYGRYEFDAPEQHAGLLLVLKQLRCNVVVSHYADELYEKLLAGWRRIDFPAMTRGGVRTEVVWCNFPEPASYHDPFLANIGYRERERMKKKRERWVARFRAMPAAERQTIAEALKMAESLPLPLGARKTSNSSNAGALDLCAPTCDTPLFADARSMMDPHAIPGGEVLTVVSGGASSPGVCG